MKSFVFCLFTLIASSASALDLPVRYFPDDTDLMVSLPLSEVRTNEAYRQLREEFLPVREGEEFISNDNRVEFGNIARLTIAGSLVIGPPLVIVQTVRPVTAAAIKAAWPIAKYQKNFRIDEEVRGQFTILRATYGDRPSATPPTHAPSPGVNNEVVSLPQVAGVCAIADAHTVLIGNYNAAPVVEAVVARGKRPVDLSRNMVDALARIATAPANAGAYACLPTKLQRDWQFLERDTGFSLPHGITKKLLESINSVTAIAVPRERNVWVASTIACKSGKDADAIEKLVKAVGVVWEQQLEDIEYLPVSLHQSLSRVYVARSFADVNGNAIVSSNDVADWFRGILRKEAREMEEANRRKEREGGGAPRNSIKDPHPSMPRD
jgi:hypothetical protein